jgi:hypothetical protein
MYLLSGLCPEGDGRRRSGARGSGAE